MLIPRGILKLEKIASKEETRYAMNGIAFDRDPSTREAIAVATDGKRLLECRWDDSTLAHDFPACGLDLSQRKDRHMSVIPLDAIKASEKNVPRKGAPCVRFLALEEPTAANGTVRLATVGENGPTVSEIKAVDGHFPPYDDPGVQPKGHARMLIGLNARLLLDLAEALAAARENEREENADCVVLEIRDETSPIVVRGMGPNLSGVKTRALLMPINHGEEQPVRSCDCDHCASLVRKPAERATAPAPAAPKPKAKRKPKASASRETAAPATSERNACALVAGAVTWAYRCASPVASNPKGRTT